MKVMVVTVLLITSACKFLPSKQASEDLSYLFSNSQLPERAELNMLIEAFLEAEKNCIFPDILQNRITWGELPATHGNKDEFYRHCIHETLEVLHVTAGEEGDPVLLSTVTLRSKKNHKKYLLMAIYYKRWYLYPLEETGNKLR
jgi:hypothetical protein